MNIEQLMILKGANEISDRILRFINTIVVKNTQEADLNETSDTFEKYEKLNKCINKTTKFDDHIFSNEDLPLELQDKSTVFLNNELLNNNSVAIEFIQNLRDEYIDGYIDENPYYSVLTGNPSEASQIIHIIDRDDSDLKFFDVTEKLIEYDNYDLTDGNLTLYDVKKSVFPNFYKYLYEEINEYGTLNIEKDYNIYKKIPIHKVKYKTNPNTYTAIYVDGILDKIRSNKKTNYEYLKYIELNLDIHTVRNADHFDIIWYDSSILNISELDNFFNSYSIVREYILKNKYVKNLEELYAHYSNFELMVILFGTFQKMCVSFIDTYSVRNYTDREIYDILDSHNLSSLKSVDMSVLRRVIDNIDVLLAYRGTEQVLSKIMEVVSKDSAMSIKKYDLVKKFKTDELGVVGLNTSRGLYDKNVDLAFVDRTIVTSTKAISATGADKQVIDYEDFVLQDPSWANSGRYESYESKINAIRKVKNDILRMEFNRMETKYIGAISIIDAYDNYEYMTHKLGLLIQYYGGFTALNNLKYTFNGSSLTPLQLYTLASCANKHIISLDNPSIEYDDTITEDCYSYGKMLRLNVLSKNSTVEILSNIKFKPFYTNLSDIIVSEIRIGDVLTADEISNSIIFFDTSRLSFSDIVRQYDQNYKKMNELINKSMESGDYNEIMAWKAINDYFLVDVNNRTDYQIPLSFEDYFNKEGGETQFLYETFIVAGSSEEIRRFSKDISRAFRNSIRTEIEEDEDAFKSDDGVKIGSDLGKMINAFVSVYIELRDVTVNLNMSDYPYNKLQYMDRSFISSEDIFRDFVGMSYEFSNYEFSKVTENIRYKEIDMSQERL